MKLSGDFWKSGISSPCTDNKDPYCQYNVQRAFVPVFCPWRGYVLLVPYILKLGKAWKENHEELYFSLVLSEIIASLRGDKCKLLCYLFFSTLFFMFCPFGTVQAGKPKPAFPLKLFHVPQRAHPPRLFSPPETLLGLYSAKPCKALLHDDNCRQIVHGSALLCKSGSILHQWWRESRVGCSAPRGYGGGDSLPAPSTGHGTNHHPSCRQMPPEAPSLGSGEGWSCRPRQRGRILSLQAVKLLLHPTHRWKAGAGGRARRQVPVAGGELPGKDCAWCGLEASVRAGVKMAGQLAH